MKERPILFSAPMIRAILSGQKTQTRQIIKPQPSWIESSGRWCWQIPKRALQKDCSNRCYTASREWYEYMPPNCCPYGQPGDRLWVRETYVIESNRYADDPYPPPHDDGRPIMRYDNHWDQPHYRATDPTPELWYDDLCDPGCRWRPSIHMPRWASRITLEITDVRIERLQDLSEEDAKAEGAPDYEEGVDAPPPDIDHEWSFRASFQRLWDSINGAGSWDANPWVWVIEFKCLGGDAA